MVAGGAEAAICRLGIAGFIACRALSTNFNDTPHAGVAPYDKDRDGFVMGEGAGVLVLEEYEHAKAARREDLRRGHRLRPVRRRLPHHRPGRGRRRRLPRHEGGAEARRSRHRPDRLRQRPRHLDAAGRRDRAAARSSGCSASDAYKLSMSSTKSATGHLLGAAGAVEAIFSILAIRDQTRRRPSTSTIRRGLRHRSGAQAGQAAASAAIALSNSFGFGGTNASLVFGPV